MSDLDGLIAAVEAGDWLAVLTAAGKAFPKDTADVDRRNCYYWVLDAYRNPHGLDAAHRLHEALFPGWHYLLRSGSEWDCANTGCEPGDHMARVMTPDWDSGYKGTGYVGWAPSPARAWLLAVLRAVKAQEGK